MTTFIREIRPDEAEFSISIEEEYCDPDFDKETNAGILKRARKGDVWAWCTVTVHAKWNSFEGTAGLGCCSYDDEEDFKKCDYYGDLCTEALHDMQRSIEKIAALLEPLMTQDSVNEWIIARIQED